MFEPVKVDAARALGELILFGRSRPGRGLDTGAGSPSKLTFFRRPDRGLYRSKNKEDESM